MTFDLLIDAVEELLAEREYDDITVADIVARADRTVGSFYTRFGDKDAALLALAARRWERDRVMVTAFLDPERWDDSTLEDLLRAGIVAMLTVYRASRLPLRSTVIKSADDAGFRRQRAAMVHELYEMTRRAALSKVDDMTSSDPERAILTGFRHVVAVLDHLLLFGSFWPADDVPDHVIIEDLVDFQMRLFCDGTADGRSPDLGKPPVS